MICSAIVATYLKQAHPEIPFESALLIIIAITVPVALLVTFLTPPVQDETLRDFYQRVRPGRWGWRRIAAKYGIPRSPYLAKAVVNLLLGLALLFLVNFGVGTLLLRSRWLGIVELLAGALLALVLIKRIREEEQLPDPPDSAPSSPGQGIV
jgi:hypothetical protein